MRYFLCVALMLLIAAPSFLDRPCHAQASPPQDNSAPSGQWLSHQMNQPPPDQARKLVLSEEVIEEIRRLYLQAKKELDDKAAKQKTAP